MRCAATFSRFGSFAPDERPQEESSHPNRRSARTTASKQEEIVEFPPVVVTPTREAERADRVAQSVSQVDDEDEGTPAWWTLNVRFGVEVARGLWFTAGVENLFNYRYRVHGSGIDAPGRNFTFAADYVF